MGSYCHPFWSAFAGTCGGEHPASINPCSKCMAVKPGSLTVSGKVPVTSVQPGFLISVELWVFPHSILPQCSFCDLLCEFGFWMSSCCSTNELYFLLFEMQFGWKTAQHHVMCPVLHIASNKVRWNRSVFCLFGRYTQCYRSSTSAESVAYFCSLVLHIAPVLQSWWIKTGLRARWLFWELVVQERLVHWQLVRKLWAQVSITLLWYCTSSLM